MKRMIQILTASSILLWSSACSGSDKTSTYEEDGYVADDSSYDNAVAEGYDGGVGGSGLTFEGYECTEDCSGHEAGYSWAEENGITDPNDCGGNSQSFIEGCMAYTE